TKTGFFASMPAPLKLIAPPIVRKDMKRKLFHQGVGRHTPEEIAEIGKMDLIALSGILGDKTFLLGEEPTSFDASVYAFTASFLFVPIPTPFKELIENTQNLRAYSERMRKRYYA